MYLRVLKHRGAGTLRALAALAALAILGAAVLVGGRVEAAGVSAQAAAQAAAPILRWVEVTPLLGDGPVRTRIFGPDETADDLLLEGEGRQLVCVGGERGGAGGVARPWAVRCTEQLVVSGDRVSLVWGDGVEVAGRLWVDREPAAGSRVTVLPAALRTVRFHSMPLRLDTDRPDPDRPGLPHRPARPQGKDPELVRSVESDGEGRFRLPALAPGRYLLAFRLPGGRLVHSDPVVVPDPSDLRPARRRGDEESGSGATRDAVPEAPPVLDLGDLLFEGGSSLRVQVIDSDGLPVEGARIGASQGTLPGVEHYEAVGDRDGVAVLSGLDPLLPVRVSCGGPGLRWHHQPYDALPTFHVCHVERLARLALRVVDGEGEPVRATVRVRGTAAPSAADRAGGDGPPGVPGAVDAPDPDAGPPVTPEPRTTDRAGEVVFPSLPAGRYRLQIAAPGYATGRARAELAPGQQVELEPVVLHPGLPWEGRVVNAVTGDPIPGARVKAADPPGAFQATTDADGVFTAVTGTDAPLRVALQAPGYPRTEHPVPAEDLEGGEPVVLELSPGGFVEVRYWTEEGEPCGGCSVSLIGPSGTGVLVTDAAGRARSAALAPGRYQVTPQELRTFGGVVSRSGGHRNRFADVRPGQVEQVVLGDPRRRVEVEVVPPPPPGWYLTVRGARESEHAALDPTGRGTVRWPGGAVRVLLGDGAGGWVELARFPEPPEQPTVELALPPGGVRGVLVAGDEARDQEGPAGRPVSLVDATTGTVRARTFSRAGGHLHLPFVPPGTYSLAVDDRNVRSVVVGNRTEALGEIRTDG